MSARFPRMRASVQWLNIGKNDQGKLFINYSNDAALIVQVTIPVSTMQRAARL